MTGVRATAQSSPRLGRLSLGLHVFLDGVGVVLDGRFFWSVSVFLVAGVFLDGSRRMFFLTVGVFLDGVGVFLDGGGVFLDG